MSPDRKLEWDLAVAGMARFYDEFQAYGGPPPTIAIWDRELKDVYDGNPATLTVIPLSGPDTPLPWHRRLLMATTPEGRLKKKVKALLKARGAWSYMPSQNGMGVVGIPDFMCCYRGLLLGIETKAPLKNPTSAEQRWKKATPNQQNRITEIREAGGLAEVVDDIEQVEHMLRVADVRAALMQGIHHDTGGLFDGR